MKLQITKRSRTVVSVTPKAPPQLAVSSADPRLEPLKRLKEAVDAVKAKDRVVEQRNQNVTIDDPTSKVNKKRLISEFSDNRNSHLTTFLELLLHEVAGLSSVQDIQDVMTSIVGESAELDIARIEKLVRGIFEAKFVEKMVEKAELEPENRRYLMRQYINREWGIQPTPMQLTIKNEPNSGGKANNRRNGPAVPDKPPTGEDRPRHAARNMSVGPFGALPPSR